MLTHEELYTVCRQNQRVPADLVLVRTSEKMGTCFIRTDQLDGETDWKLRLAVPSTHRLSSEMVPYLPFLPSFSFFLIFKTTIFCQNFDDTLHDGDKPWRFGWKSRSVMVRRSMVSSDCQNLSLYLISENFVFYQSNYFNYQFLFIILLSL